ncbi:MBL fold metallo-hydrolase [Treponema phagedenis]|uniref:MBL fold metallo-hydrolase n=1 Tax=Treponema phagedenis TaxID=162 RepID=A0A0B7GTR1_TREPH|nr:MBL fold metallo-hydrolase [Treponema phagedenis]EFW37809.1 metallo-beta-lactamase domain protein [Treponema phagedenis F0421]NVP25158.1 MBL fold metallo-hydrolase [Treponema phagedenis]QEJ96024.1 MBL fold metallo-hydrolase [Treponema phagedenis]QEJ97272.1 MBL fold metallo-hydrolase [Treponema phagedenis]QEK01788.1 MBL fold metallo-hydrolase [Treponema phagedenis]
MKEVYQNIFMKEIPLTGNPLKSINIFIIKTPEESLIVDTGFNNEEVREHMMLFLNELKIDLNNTALFLTHLHADHIGLASFLQGKGVRKIYLSAVDGAIIKNGFKKESSHWQRIIKNSHRQGMDIEGLKIEEHPGFKNRSEKSFSYIPCKPGDTLSIGDFHFVFLDEAGHTPGMLGLYEAEKKILFCGDHILGKITPNITYWGEEFGDSLGIYMKNLNKIKNYSIDHLFSSHRFLVDDVNKRIDEILHHHRVRLDEIMSILRQDEALTVRDVTCRMHWDIRAKNWENFPPSQKWFAAGEAAAHLLHLVQLGKVIETIDDNGVAWYKIRA